MNCSGNIFFCLCAALLLVVGNSRAETVFWSDNFETNAASHWTNNGVWHIGSPTAGPALNAAGYRTHSAANCASTQNYPYNQDARMVCTNYNGNSSLFIPTNQFPRLRFWHWFNYANALGYVEISTNNGGSWTQISPTYLNITGGGIWSRPAIDLSAFAGQSVQIAFHFTSGCCTGNALGWYVDDVAVVTNEPVLNNPESFESGPDTNDWAVDYGTWEIGKPTGGPGYTPFGTNCAGTILVGNYPNNVDSRLISPLFIVPNSTSQALRFWHWYNFNNALGYVEIRVGTGSWTQLSPTYINANTGGAWTNVSLDLSVYAGQTVQAAFHFTSGGIYTAPGWYVDDVSLVAAPVLTVLPTNLLSFYAGTTLTVTNTATLCPSNTFANFTLIPGLANGLTLITNGTMLTWTWDTNTAKLPGYYTNIIEVTDTNGFSATNSFVVQVLQSLPVLNPANISTNIYAGQKFTVTYSATNSIFPNAIYTFSLASPSTNAFINMTNGVLTWTNTNTTIAGTYTNYVIATDNSLPPLGATNSFIVQVLLPPALKIAAVAQPTNGSFQLTFSTISNTTWRIEASTNLLSTNWLSLLTNMVGPGGTLQFTDLLATNFPRRFYRAVLQ
jgi:hypothetical protein